MKTHFSNTLRAGWRSGWVQSLWERGVQLVFPPRCVACEAYVRRDAFVCPRCRHALFTIEGPMCTICGEPRPAQSGGYAGVDARCGRCIEQRPQYARARSLWEYSGSIADAIQRAKYGGQLWVLRELATQLGPWLLDEIDVLTGAHDPAKSTPQDDQPTPFGQMPAPRILLTSVPMHPKDLRKRGFDVPYLLLNQCLKVRATPYKIVDIVQKVRHTPSQAGLDFAARQTNLRRAFACRPGCEISGATIVLFDDVFTTGATAHEVAKTLRRAGAARVHVFSAARAVGG